MLLTCQRLIDTSFLCNRVWPTTVEKELLISMLQKSYINCYRIKSRWHNWKQEDVW